MADVNASANTDKYPHQVVYDHTLAAFNEPSLMPDIADLFGDNEDVSYCDPFPHCVAGQHSIRAHLKSVSESLVDSYMLPLNLPEKDQFFIGNGGGFWAPSFVMSVAQTEAADLAWKAEWNTTANKTCIVGSGQYVQWFFAPNTTELLQIRIYYDEEVRHAQAQRCLADPSRLILTGDKGTDASDASQYQYAGKVGAATRTKAETRQALERLFSTLQHRTAELPVVSAENVHVWQGLFTDQPEQQAQIELCAFYPFCFYGDEAKPSMWAWQDTDGEMERLLFTGGAPVVSVAGNVGSAMTSFTNTVNGCLESHHQFMVFTLAEGSDKAQAISILAAHPSISMAYHDCHNKHPGSYWTADP